MKANRTRVFVALAAKNKSLREIASEMDMVQSSLSHKINGTGSSRWLSGEIDKLAGLLGVSTAWLVSDDPVVFVGTVSKSDDIARTPELTYWMDTAEALKNELAVLNRRFSEERGRARTIAERMRSITMNMSVVSHATKSAAIQQAVNEALFSMIAASVHACPNCGSVSVVSSGVAGWRLCADCLDRLPDPWGEE